MDDNKGQGHYSSCEVCSGRLWFAGASGAMALKLNGIDETTIKKLGQWSDWKFNGRSIYKSDSMSTQFLQCGSSVMNTAPSHEARWKEEEKMTGENSVWGDKFPFVGKFFMDLFWEALGTESQRAEQAVRTGGRLLTH
eukprot:6699003-Ditylum_brightwellii.AAC.1